MATRALVTSVDVHRENGTLLMARGIGVMSLMLGGIDLMGAKPLAASLGIRGQETMIRLYGVREILQGWAILVAAVFEAMGFQVRGARGPQVVMNTRNYGTDGLMGVCPEQ